MDALQKLAALYKWTQSDMNQQDEEFLQSMIESLGPYTKVQILEKLLAHYRDKAEQIVNSKIPDIMQENGVDTVGLPDGTKITLSKYYNFKKKEMAIDWLYRNGFADIVKNDISVGSGAIPEEIINALDKTGVEYDIKQDVHPQTLKAALSRYIENGGSLPQDAFEYSIFVKAKVK